MLLPDDLAAHLVKLGLAPDDASAYVHLALMGSADVQAFARVEAVPPAQAELTLRRLAAKGLAIRVGGGAIYVPTPPEDVRVRLAKGAHGGLRILRGRAEGNAVAAEMLGRVQREVRFVNTSPAGFDVAQLAGLHDIGSERAKAGIYILGALHSSRATRAALGPMLRSSHVQIYHVETDRPIRALVVDQAEAIVGVTTSEAVSLQAPEEVTLWTSEPDFVAAQLELVNSIIAKGKDLRWMIHDDKFGEGGAR